MIARDENRLAPYLEEREDWVFGYGREPRMHDCARFNGAGVEAVTGVNPLKAFTSTWTSALGAARVLRRHGGMATAVSEVMREIDPRHARRGDVAMSADGALSLVEGQTIVGLGPTGYRRQPRTAIVQAWSV